MPKPLNIKVAELSCDLLLESKEYNKKKVNIVFYTIWLLVTVVLLTLFIPIIYGVYISMYVIAISLVLYYYYDYMIKSVDIKFIIKKDLIVSRFTIKDHYDLKVLKNMDDDGSFYDAN